MKTYSLLLLILFFGLTFRLEAQSYTYSLCSGQKQVLEAKDFITGSQFEWYTDNIKLNETTNKMEVSLTTLSLVTRLYTCNLKMNNSVYQSYQFTVTFLPVTTVDINATPLCEGKLVTFSMSDLNGIKEQKWTIGNEIFLNKTISYLCGTVPVTVNLKVMNQYGCWSNEIIKGYNINKDPHIAIKELPMSLQSREGIYCGNSYSRFTVNGLKDNYKLNRWKILIDKTCSIEIPADKTGLLVLNKCLVEKAVVGKDTLTVKWEKTKNTSYNIELFAFFSNGNCEFQSGIKATLIDDDTPDAFDVFQKPNNSNVLIFPNGKDSTNLNYAWGFTRPSGENSIYKNNKLFYCEFDNIDPVNKYWVETWKDGNPFCVIRNEAKNVASSEKTPCASLIIYPNPVENGQLSVKIDYPAKGRIIITDILGKIKEEQPVKEGISQVVYKFNGFQPGIYAYSYLASSGELIKSGHFMIK